jgi:uracil-DNA glycosylase family 4
MPHHGTGPIPAKIMLVGEAWGEEEERAGEPFAGPSGQELNRLLQEAGLYRTDCFVTNLVNRRPPNNYLGAWIPTKKKDITAAHVRLRDKMVLPLVVEGYDQLLSEIKMVEPNVIVACGNAALWALTGKWGIMNWRGSMLSSDSLPSRYKVIPTIHPAAVLREWKLRRSVLEDLRRVKREYTSREYNLPNWQFRIRPTFSQVIETFDALRDRAERGEEVWLDFDIETRSGHIECFSVSWSREDAICVPIMAYDGGEGYWSLEEETHIVWATYRLLTHKNVRVRAQNGLYDAQYVHRWWGFLLRIGQDTMISQHAVFSDLPKALHYQASLYAHHYVYWKDEGKTWNPKMAPEQRWNYNCLDCVYTREVGEVEQNTVRALGLEKVHTFQQAMFWPVLKAMLRGCRINEQNAGRLADEVQGQIELRENFLLDVLGMPVNINSSKQMQALFYEDLQQPVIMTRAKKGVPAHPTCDDEALQKIGNREPLLRPITNCIADILAKRDVDKRMRCSFNIGGSESGKSAPKTYRLSSSKNAFGSGANLQTIPSEKSKSVGKWMARRKEETINLLGDPYELPNLRSMFMPDERQTFFDMDLDRADLQVMAWDADEALLKAALRMKVDIHLLNVYILDNKEPPPLEELVETHPKYPDHRGPRKHKREFAKVFCHATDYLGKSRTVAAATGRTVAETERAQKIYLGRYSGIKKWQDRIIEEVRKKRYVENKFGYRWYIFDRIDDSVMPEAVAWIPQSTVSIVINRIWMNLYQGVPESEWDFSLDKMLHLFHNSPWGIEVLLQVHDSLAGQFPTHMKETCLGKIMELSKIVVPYDDPLIIPTGIGTSEASWGEC